MLIPKSIRINLVGTTNSDKKGEISNVNQIVLNLLYDANSIGALAAIILACSMGLVWLAKTLLSL